MEPVWPDAELEKQMINDAEYPSCNPDGTDRDVACHIKALLCRVRELEDEVERLSPYGPGGEYYTPYHVLQFASDPAKPAPPIDITANPPPDVCEMMQRYVGSMVDAELVKQAKDGPASAIFTTLEPNQ